MNSIPQRALATHLGNSCNYENIPQTLKQLRAWGITIPGKDAQAQKRPHNARSGLPAKNNAPDTWSTFDEALAAVQAGLAVGLGFFVHPECGHIVFDFDRCYDDYGMLHPRAQELQDLLAPPGPDGIPDGYVELSRSRRGFHVIVQGTWPSGDQRAKDNYLLDPSNKAPDAPHVEVFHRVQFVILTGNTIDDEPHEPRACQDRIDTVDAELQASVQEVPLTPTDDLRHAKAERFVQQAIGRATQGEGRNNVGSWLAQQLRYLFPDDKSAAWHYLNDEYRELVQHLGTHAYDEAEARATLESWYRKPAKAPAFGVAPEGVGEVAQQIGGVTITSRGVADLFVERYGQDVRYVAVHDRWYLWDSPIWRSDKTLGNRRRAIETIKSLYSRAAELASDDDRKRLVKFAMKMDNDGSLGDMLRIARVLHPIATASDAFDLDPMILACKNGVIDLRTGKLREARQEDLATRLAARAPWLPTATPAVDDGTFAYESEKACPNWLAFLDRVLAGNQELIRWVQKAVGYTLTGDISEQVLFLLWGGGNNGKSTFISVLQALLGDYAGTLAIDALLVRQYEGIPNDIAALQAARLVVTGENEQGRRLAEARIKQYTGGDLIKARFMRGEWFEFRPSFKLWVHTNHKPQIRGTDKGIWRRIRLIPFTVEIPAAEVDPRFLETKLIPELPGILAWAVQGCRMWQREGLKPEPAVVIEAVEEYRSEMDLISQFLSECTVREANAHERSSDLYQFYKDWCEKLGERYETQRTFSQRVTAITGISTKNVHGKGMAFQGLRATNRLHVSEPQQENKLF